MTTLTATCDGRSTGRTATDWGIESLPCNTTVGLTTWTDTEGQSHRACHPHLAAMRRRFPEQESWDARKARIDAAVMADPEHESIR